MGSFLKRSTFEHIASVTRLTMALSGRTYEDVFREFRRQFFDRYEFRLVPLSVVFDPQAGLSFKDSLVSFLEAWEEFR